MNMREIAVEYRLTHWAQIVQDRNGSGLSIKAYCKSAGIREYQYYYWLKKLREATCGELARVHGNAPNLATPIFAEVRLPERPVLPPMGDIQRNHIRVEVAGMRITAGDEYPVDRLAELLRMVVQPCC